VNPLLTLGSLTTDIEHAVGQIANDEGGLGDTSGLDTRAEDILVSGEVVGLSNAVNSIEVTGASMMLANCWASCRGRLQRHRKISQCPLTIWQSRSAGIHANA
jgi:hypothetical protein